MTRRIAVLGATGSIGTQTLEVVREYPEEFEVVALSSHSSVDHLKQLTDEFSPQVSAITNSSVSCPSDWIQGGEALTDIAALDIDLLILAVVGAAGLKPCLTALQEGTNVALSNKEVLVIGSEIIHESREQTSAELIPVDSELSAIFQLKRGENVEDIKKVIITASGGPFFDWSISDLADVSPQQALDHPNWDMGPKITIDSATMMNKGLEVMETMHLLQLDIDRVEALIHPQSHVHGMIEFHDHSITAQCSVPNMKLTIQYALFYPDRREALVESLDFNQSHEWEFYPIDTEKYPAYELARSAAEEGGCAPAIINAANETAVSAFLKEKITFREITDYVGKTLNEHSFDGSPDLEAIESADTWARKFVNDLI